MSFWRWLRQLGWRGAIMSEGDVSDLPDPDQFGVLFGHKANQTNFVGDDLVIHQLMRDNRRIEVSPISGKVMAAVKYVVIT